MCSIVAWLGAALVATLPAANAEAQSARAARPLAEGMERPLLPSASAWGASGNATIRGITIGPIENTYHPAVGYGTEAFSRALVESRDNGANWIALTPFGRVADLSGRGVDPTFEAPHEDNRAAIERSIRWAHELGLKVMLVPHLWVESGDWRALIDPQSEAGWHAWEESYRRFVLAWADVAEREHVELLSAGVELRSWVTTAHAPSFVRLLRSIRERYHGLLTYSANWDDVETTIPLGELDLIGINAFYPLAEKDDADLKTLLEGGARVRERVHALAEAWKKPVLFTEIGYTTRPNPAVKPWEWPDKMKNVVVDQKAQAEAYRALLAPFTSEPAFAGFFVWRVYADPDDVSQEAEWGFSPRKKLAERVMREVFRTRFETERNRWFFQALSKP